MLCLLTRYCARTLVAVFALTLGLQAYACIATHIARQAGMPPNFGNFPRIRQALATPGKNGPLTFAIVGDTRSTGTFEGLAQDINSKHPAFLVILGDWVDRGTSDEHALFRLETPEFGFRCPVFFTPGNHDVDPDKYPVDRFEKEYGPCNFSFEYGNNIFIFIRHLDKRFSNKESIAYLHSFDPKLLDHYDNRFLFMHIPPWVSPDIKERHTRDEQEIMDACKKLNINYVIAADFHGYNRTKHDGIEYIITGGGGARLDTSTGEQFHHAIALTVDGKMMSEQIIPGSSHFKIGEWIEKKSIVYIGPFILRHLPVFLCMDILGLAIVWAVLRIRRKRREPSSIPIRHTDDSGDARHR